MANEEQQDNPKWVNVKLVIKQRPRPSGMKEYKPGPIKLVIKGRDDKNVTPEETPEASK